MQPNQSIQSNPVKALIILHHDRPWRAPRTQAAVLLWLAPPPVSAQAGLSSCLRVAFAFPLPCDVCRFFVQVRVARMCLRYWLDGIRPDCAS